jgi:hypothetical protein
MTMKTFQFEYSSVINARPEQVYALFRDYRVSHPAILPKPAFQSLTVLEGGLGAGTKFSADMQILGSKSTIVMTVSEPEPGRVLLEENPDFKSFFIMDPVENGQKTRVTLRTEARDKGGIQGFIEKMLVAPALRRVYKKELENVEAYLAAKR